ncbi:MAG: hypothetical protein KC503_01685 [Myxococcales bacterium]|nr:hypothetical protein [Myxococcales bacterium]
MKRLRKPLLCLLVALAAAGCAADKVTEIVVRVDTDLAVGAGIDMLGFSVRYLDRSETLLDVNWDVDPNVADHVVFPVELGILPGRDPSRVVHFEARALLDGKERVNRRAALTFATDRIVLLRLNLLDRCIGKTCAEDKTCGEQGCEDVLKDADKLPDYAAGDAGTPDSAGDGARDGGGGDGDASDDAPREAGGGDGADSGADGPGVDAVVPTKTECNQTDVPVVDLQPTTVKQYEMTWAVDRAQQPHLAYWDRGAIRPDFHHYAYQGGVWVNETVGIADLGITGTLRHAGVGFDRRDRMHIAGVDNNLGTLILSTRAANAFAASWPAAGVLGPFEATRFVQFDRDALDPTLAVTLSDDRTLVRYDGTTAGATLSFARALHRQCATCGPYVNGPRSVARSGALLVTGAFRSGQGPGYELSASNASGPFDAFNVGEGRPGDVAVAIDSKGVVHMVYNLGVSTSEGKLTYRRWQPGAAPGSEHSVDPSTTVSLRGVDIVIGPNDTPYIGYYEHVTVTSSARVHVVSVTGVATPQFLPANAPLLSNAAALGFLDTSFLRLAHLSGRFHVLYSDTTQKLRYRCYEP